MNTLRAFVDNLQRTHSLATNHVQASACSPTNSAEGETEDSNIDSGAERMVNVFLSQPDLVFVCHTWVIV